MQKILLILALLSPLASLQAQTAEEKGHAIAVEVHERDNGWVDLTADMQMILRNKQGDKSERFLRMSFLEVEDDGDKSLTLFETPRDVKGTAFLSYTHALEDDDQWLYLPALKRVKRIASSNKSGPFMGSEFAYEDLSSQEVEKYNYRWLRDEEINGKTAWVIERIPVYQNSGYTRQVVWINQQIYQPVRIEFYDRKDALLKTLTYGEYQQYEDQFWRPTTMDMVNHQTGKGTTLVWENYLFKTGLSANDFHLNRLKSMR